MHFHYKFLSVLKILLKVLLILINFKGIVWNEEDMGMTFEEVEIPADILDEADYVQRAIYD